MPRAQIDPRYRDTPYYIAPEDKVSQDAFAVIREAIYGFKATGADHDTLQLSSGAGTLAQVLAKATGDGQRGTVLHIGTGETVDLINITKAELKAHHGDFAFGAVTMA